MEFIKEFVRFTLKRKKYWLFPIFIAAFFLGLLLTLSPGAGLAPFIYTVY